MRMLLPFTFVLLVGAAAASAAERPIVLELFTSEGCSSCPPADRLLTELAKRRDVLPLAFHVTYWNALGWRDPFSFEGATRRQARYATILGGNSYTPELVVDGREGMVGSDVAAVQTALATASAALHANTSAVTALIARGDKLEIHVSGASAGARVLLVGFDPQHQTDVGRGENEGRRLTESNVVRSLIPVATTTGEPISIRVDRSAGERHAVLIQDDGGRIIGAAAL